MEFIIFKMNLIICPRSHSPSTSLLPALRLAMKSPTLPDGVDLRLFLFTDSVSVGASAAFFTPAIIASRISAEITEAWVESLFVAA